MGSVLKGPLADEPEPSDEDVLSALQDVDDDELDVADVAVLHLDSGVHGDDRKMNEIFTACATLGASHQER